MYTDENRIINDLTILKGLMRIKDYNTLDEIMSTTIIEETSTARLITILRSIRCVKSQLEEYDQFLYDCRYEIEVYRRLGDKILQGLY